MQPNLENLCKGISDILKEEGHEGVLYSISDNAGKVVSDREEYEVLKKEEDSEIVFEVTRKNGRVNDTICDYVVENYKCSKSFPEGKMIVLRVGHEG